MILPNNCFRTRQYLSLADDPYNIDYAHVTALLQQLAAPPPPPPALQPIASQGLGAAAEDCDIGCEHEWDEQGLPSSSDAAALRIDGSAPPADSPASAAAAARQAQVGAGKRQRATGASGGARWVAAGTLVSKRARADLDALEE